jgi:tetratricopeptide (TPR) repeat protein
MFETDRAIDELKIALAARSATHASSDRARASLQLGAAYDRLGQRTLAVKAYTDAIADAPPDDAQRIRERARAGLRQKPDARDTESYRLSLEGWRSLERGAKEEAEASLARAVALSPSDAVARYRYARVLEERGESPRARDELEKVLAGRPLAPAIVLASAFVDYARLLERAGEQSRALTMYRYAIDVVGGDPRAHRDAMLALKRLAGGGAGAKIFDF